MSSTFTRGPRSVGVWAVSKVTVISESDKVTGSPLNAGKIAGTIAGGQIEVSSLPARYVILYVNILEINLDKGV
jgi:hypothetical protein